MSRGLARFAWAASFVVLVALTAFGAREVDRALTVRMAALKSAAIQELERLTGRRISYAEISPSFFRRISVRELSIHDSENPERSLLTIHEVQVYYSLFRLLADRDPLAAVREIRLMNSRFTIDLESDHDVVELVQSLLKAGDGQGLHARISGSDIGVTLISRDSSVSLSHLFFQVDAQSPSIAISLRGGVGARMPGGFQFDSNLSAQGTLERSLTASDMTVRLASFTSSIVNVGPQTVQLVWKGDTLDVRKIQDRSPIVLDLRADLAAEQYTLSFQSQDMRLDRLVSFSPRFARYSNWLKVPLTSSGHVTYRAADRALEYQADASALLEDQLPIRQVTLSAAVRGSEKEMFFSPLRLSSDEGNAEFDGSILLDTLYPSGLLSLADVRTADGESVNAALAIERAKGSLSVRSTHLTIGEVGFDAFQLTLSPGTGGAAFSLSTSFTGSPAEDSVQASGELHFGKEVGQAVTSGSVRALPAPLVSVTATLRNVPPAKLYHLASGAGRLSVDQQDLYALLSHYSVSTEATVSTDFSQLSLQARSVTISSNDDPGVGFHFGLGLDKSHLSLTGFSGTWKGVSIEGGFEGDLGEGGQIGFASNLTLLGSSYFFTGRYSRTSGLVATGSYGLSISAVPLRGGGALLKLKGEKFPLPVEGAPLPVTFDVSGIATPEGEWSADFPTIVIYDVPLPRAPHSVVQLSGRVTKKQLDLSRIVVTTSDATLFGSAHLALTLPPDLFDAGFLSALGVQGTAALRSEDGEESYAVNGGAAKGILALTTQFSGVPVTRVGITEVTGTLSGSAAVNGPFAQPQADIAVSLKQGRLGTDPLSLDGQAVLKQGSVQVQSVSAVYLAHKLSGGSGSVDLSRDAFSFSGTFQTEVFQDAIKVKLAVDGSWSGAPLDSGVFDLGLQGKMSLSEITVAGTAMPSWGVTFRTDSKRITFDGGPGNSVHGWIDPRMTFSASLLEPMPVTGRLAGSVEQGRIDASFDVDSFDMLVLNPILKSTPVDMGTGPTPAVRFTAGVGSGRLLVNGEVNDPDFTGQLDIVGGGIVTAYSPAEAGPVRTSLIFEGKSFHTTRTLATAGAAHLSAQASFAIDHWIPSTWDVKLATEDKTAVRVRARFGVLNTDGSVAGDIHVTGDDRATAIEGNLTLSDCRITLGRAPAGKFVPEEPPTIANVTVETGRRVEFQWPTADVPVVRTTATPGGKIAVTYRGDTGAYTVKGGTAVQGGEIYYFDRTFIMKRGSISFNEDQATFDPWITARAEVREWDQSSGTEVRIFLDADSPFSRFSPRFSSDPTRTDAEILSMIGAPLVSRAETQGVGMAAFVYSDVLTQNWILRPFEQKVRQALNLDMFSVRTQIIQNLAAQRVLGTTVNPLDNTSVSIGKYLGNDLFLELLVRLQQPQVPVAIVTSGGGLLAASTELQPDLELSLEWATPFFLLEWSFLPKHPESLYLSDNSLSFSWRYSY